MSQRSADVFLTPVCITCRYFGESWVQAMASHHFRCALCGTLYRPWASEWRKYNKILVVRNGLAAGTDGGMTMIPCMWVDSDEEGFLNNKCEAYARQVRTSSRRARRMIVKSACIHSIVHSAFAAALVLSTYCLM